MNTPKHFNQGPPSIDSLNNVWEANQRAMPVGTSEAVNADIGYSNELPDPKNTVSMADAISAASFQPTDAELLRQQAASAPVRLAGKVGVSAAEGNTTHVDAASPEEVADMQSKLQAAQSNQQARQKSARTQPISRTVSIDSTWASDSQMISARREERSGNMHGTFPGSM